MQTATVNSGGQGAVNFRQGPDSSAKLCFKNPKIPEGAQVEVLGTQGEFTRLTYYGENGWMKSEYVAAGGAVEESPKPVENVGSDTVSIPRATAEAFYNTLGNILGK